jgi:hypothetical protein
LDVKQQLAGFRCFKKIDALLLCALNFAELYDRRSPWLNETRRNERREYST